MGRLVEFDVADGGTVLVEVAEVAGGSLAPGAGELPVTRGIDGGAIAEQARRTFEEGSTG